MCSECTTCTTTRDASDHRVAETITYEGHMHGPGSSGPHTERLQASHKKRR